MIRSQRKRIQIANFRLLFCPKFVYYLSSDIFLQDKLSVLPQVIFEREQTAAHLRGRDENK